MSSSDGRSASDMTTWIRLRVQLTLPDLCWGPLWAALCGAVASGALRGDAPQLLTLLLVLVAADPLFANVCHLLFDCNWPFGSRANWVPGPENRPVVALPYTDEGSPGYRLARWLSQTLVWWRDYFGPEAGWMVSGVLFESGCLVALAFVFGSPILWLIGLGFVLMGLGLVARLYGSELIWGVRSLIEVGLPWLIGYMAFSSLSLVPIGLAACYALAYGASLRMASKGVGRGVWGVAAALIGLTGWLIIAKHPISGTVVGLLSLFPVWLSLSCAAKQVAARWYLGRINFYMLAIMLTAALSVVLR